MLASRGSSWGPRPLPEFLADQLTDHGYSVNDSGRIARRINEQADGSRPVALFVDLGACKFLEGDIDGAIASWRHAISSDQDDAAAQALLNLGLLYEHLHLHERALGLLGAAVDRAIEPYVLPAAMASARCQLAQGDAEQAMETMARLAQLSMADPESPDLVETLFGLGDVAEQAGRTDRAERSWRVAAAGPVSPLQEAAAIRRAKLLVDLGHDDELRDLLQEQPAAAGPAGANALLSSVEALCRMGDRERARALIEAIDRSELSVSHRFRLAAAKVQCGQVNGAIDEFESLLSHNDSEVQLRAAYGLGELYQFYEMADAATDMFERVIAADDRYWSPKAALAFGDLLRDADDHSGAKNQWRRAATGEIRYVAEQAQARLVAPSGSMAAAAETSGRAVDTTASAEAEPQVISLNDLDERADLESEDATELTQAMPPESPPEPVTGNPAADSSPAAAEAVAPAPSEPEPVIVVLSSLEDDEEDLAEFDGDVIDLSDRRESRRTSSGSAATAAQSSSIFKSHLGEIEPLNPYASLAPDDMADTPATIRNPYAELAPNYGDDEFEPPIDIEPGDWESMLDDWPIDQAPTPAKKQPSAFSRYT